jgi:hypothetical protein
MESHCGIAWNLGLSSGGTIGRSRQPQVARSRGGYIHYGNRIFSHAARQNRSSAPKIQFCDEKCYSHSDGEFGGRDEARRLANQEQSLAWMLAKSPSILCRTVGIYPAVALSSHPWTS